MANLKSPTQSQREAAFKVEKMSAKTILAADKARVKAEAEALAKTVRESIGACAIETFIDDLLRDPNHPGWKRLAVKTK